MFKIVFIICLVMLGGALDNDLPDQFWWGDVDKVNFLTIKKNQHIPIYCGSCWSFAVTSALSDRIKIMRKAAWPDINLSPQVLLSCMNENNGCHGGDPRKAYAWIQQNNITDETCSPYLAYGHDNGVGCSAQIKCKYCENGTCWVQPRPKIYTIKEHGVVAGQEQIMNEVYNRGPVSCEIGLTMEFVNYTGGIFEDKTGKQGYDHDISITGWGLQNGVKYWIIRNSWGTYWGQRGDIRLIKGVNNLGIQTNCSWGVPIDTWTNDVRNQTKPTNFVYKQFPQNNNYQNLEVQIMDTLRLKSQKNVPDFLDWRNISHLNYLTWTRNQNSPHSCNSSWAFAPTSCISDRINILNNNTLLDMSLSPQILINCNISGNCSGGQPYDVYKFAQTGLPQETCQIYQASDQNKSCTSLDVCRNCIWPPGTKPGDKGNCYGQTSYPLWFVEEFGKVFGVKDMKIELMRGPISCKMQITDGFKAYTGGIYAEAILKPISNHVVSIVGWDISHGLYYWIGRNSWGTTWGQSGFFRIQMYSNNLGIESECSWGTVTNTKKKSNSM